jgi:MFS family permease
MRLPTPSSSDARAIVRQAVPVPVRRRLSRLRQAFGQIVPDSVWHNWCWDVAAGICAGIYQGCIWTFALQLARGKMHATGFEMGVASAAPAVGYLFAIIWARQMEGRSKLPFVTLTWVLSRGLFLFTPLIVPTSHHTAAYVSLICLTPILFSVSTPAYTAIMKDIYPDQLRGRLMSYVRVGMALSMLATARVMGVLQEHSGLDFRWMFFIGGIFGVGTALAFSRLRLPPVLQVGSLPPFGQFLRDTFSILRSNVGYRWFCVSVFVTGFGNLLQQPAQYAVQVDRFHILPTQIATMQNIAGVLSLASLFFWGWYMDRFGSLPTVLAAVSINCLAPLVYAFAPSLFWLYLGAAAMGVSGSGIDLGYLNTTLMFAEPGRAAQYQAVHSTLFGLRGTLAPLLTFAIIGLMRRNWPLFFLLCLAIMVAGTFFQFFSMRTYRQQQARAVSAGT